MYRIELHDGIHKIIKGYDHLGFWHGRDEATVIQTCFKIFYSIYYLIFPISLLAGAILSDDRNESILLTLTTIVTSVLLVRLLYILWGQKGLCGSLDRICVYSIKYEEDFTMIDQKLKILMKWMKYFYAYVILVCVLGSIVIPFIGSEKKLFFSIGFPWDYKNNDFAFCIAFLFIVSEVYLSVFTVTSNIIIWYVMINCFLKYNVLASELRDMGDIKQIDAVVKERKRSEVEKQNVFKRDLIAGIESHKYINESIQQLESYLSKLFSIQLTTSAACICTSVYMLVFYDSTNIIEYVIFMYYLIYNIWDIFMVMYIGNEIQLSSDALSYCLFQSNWTEQPQSCKKCIIIFGERLKQPQTLVVLKIYPLTLETFTRIMNGAYSMFNILKTLAM